MRVGSVRPPSRSLRRSDTTFKTNSELSTPTLHLRIVTTIVLEDGPTVRLQRRAPAAGSRCGSKRHRDLPFRTCLVDGSDAETQWSTCTNGAQASPVAGAEPREVMPLVSYRASIEAVLRWKRSDRVVPGLHEIHEVAGRRQSAKQVLNAAPQFELFPRTWTQANG